MGTRNCEKSGKSGESRINDSRGAKELMRVLQEELLILQSVKFNLQKNKVQDLDRRNAL